MSKALEHPDYRIEGTNIVNYTKWSRENIPKPPHKYPIGTVVKTTLSATMNIEREGGKEICLGVKGSARLIVVGHHQDCDGTALYVLADKAIETPKTHSIVDGMKHRSFCNLVVNGYDEQSLKPTGEFVTCLTWKAFLAVMFAGS